MYQTKVVEKIKTHILRSISPTPEKRALYEIMLKNIAHRDTSQTAIWRMRMASWIPKATDTLRICNTYCFSTVTMVAHTRLSVTLYVHCRSCSKLHTKPVNTICGQNVEFLNAKPGGTQ